MVSRYCRCEFLDHLEKHPGCLLLSHASLGCLKEDRIHHRLPVAGADFEGTEVFELASRMSHCDTFYPPTQVFMGFWVYGLREVLCLSLRERAYALSLF